MGRKSDLLLDDRDLVIVQTKLAVVVGDRQAMALQQIHYWIGINEAANKETHFFDENWWVYNTWAEWHKRDFPFWSISTLRRVFSDLEAEGLIITRPHATRNNGKWVTINYGALALRATRPVRRPRSRSVENDRRSTQNEQTGLLKMNRPSAQNEQTHLTETTKTTSEKEEGADKPRTRTSPDAFRKETVLKHPLWQAYVDTFFAPPSFTQRDARTHLEIIEELSKANITPAMLTKYLSHFDDLRRPKFIWLAERIPNIVAGVGGATKEERDLAEYMSHLHIIGEERK